MRTIKSKFKSKCAKCGGVIPKGINIDYEPSTKRAYHLECTPEVENNDSAMVRANEEEYFDNFCRSNNI